MVFSSFIFLWTFLPIVFIGYFIIQDKYKNIFLLLASLVFYAWGEPKYILLMIFSVLVNYIIGLLMDKFYSYKKILLVIDIIINLGLLGYFKYFNFVIEIINYGLNTKIEASNIPLPIGISFFTFQILSYIIDLYCGKYKAQKNIINLGLYICFFPQLIAGPIVKYKDINQQLNQRTCTIDKMSEGIRRFIYGLGKKVIIANTVAYCVDTIYALDYSDITGWLAWIGAILYTLQIYYDFSGYSDMAIGLGKIFGFEFQENFNYPYLSKSIQEFWQRWHISLGTWFKEYLYIPLGGNKKGNAKTYLNLMIVFLVTGLWHGASFNFILWGIWHGILQVIERLGFNKFLVRHKGFAHIYIIIALVFGWVVFRADNLVQAFKLIIRMLLPWEYTASSFITAKIFGNKTIFIILLGILGCGIIESFLSSKKLCERYRNSYLEMAYCGIIFVLCLSMLAGNTYNPFIYFRF